MGTFKEALEQGVVPVAKKISSYFQEPVETLGQADLLIRDLISKGYISKASDLLNMSPDDLRAMRMERDRELLQAQSDKALKIRLKPKPEPPPEPETPPETDFEEMFGSEFVQDTPQPFSFADDVVAPKTTEPDITDPDFNIRAYKKNFLEKAKEEANVFYEERFSNLPENVRNDLINMPIESNSRLNRTEGVYENFDFTNEKHVFPLPYEMPDSMLQAIDEGTMAFPQRYSEEYFNNQYLAGVIGEIAQKEETPAFSIRLLLNDLGYREMGGAVFKTNTFENRDMMDQKTILDAYTNFKIRKQTSEGLEQDPDFNFSDTIYGDRGTVQDFDSFLQLKNKYRKELQNGNMDPEFDPENVGASLNKYPYVEEMLKEPGNIESRFTILEAPVDPDKFIKQSKVRNEYYEPFMYSKKEEADFEKYKVMIKGLQRGHELMTARRIEIFNKFGKDNRILNHVKYPRFFTNIQRNGVHKILEKALFDNRNKFRALALDIEKMPYLPDSTKQSMREQQKQILAVIKNISHDMKELGLETQVIRDNGIGFVKYGKGFKTPQQLLDSINKEQNLKYLTSKMSRSVAKDSNLSNSPSATQRPGGMYEDRFYLPVGYEEGGFASIEEVLEY